MGGGTFAFHCLGSLCKKMKNLLDNIEGIIFDLDDTLYPQESYKTSGFHIVSNWVASRFNLEPSSILSILEDIMEQYGPSYPFMFDRLADRMEINQELVSEMVRVFIEHEPQIQCYDGVISMLSRLRNHYRLGILTDGRLGGQQKKISALGLDNNVDEILCSDMLGLEKPAMELYEWFEYKFQLNGENLMYVGDNPTKDFFGANLRKWSTVCVMTGENRNIVIQKMFKAQFSFASVIDLEKNM